MYGHREEDGTLKAFKDGTYRAGRIAEEGRGEDVEDLPSDWMGFEFGELVATGNPFQLKVDIKNCTCEQYKETVLTALEKTKPLSDNEHKAFIKQYVPFGMTHYEGGRTGWFVRVKLTHGQRGPNKYNLTHQPYRQITIQKAIEALGF